MFVVLLVNDAITPHSSVSVLIGSPIHRRIDMDKFTRPEWDDYFMALAFVTSTRSIDPHTKHGCVIVKNKRVVGMGYNGPPSGLDDSMIPLTRPDKYFFMAHAEENAILNAENPNLKDATVYITGWPCHRCFRMLIQKEVKKIVYGCVSAACVDDADYAATKLMLDAQHLRKGNGQQIVVIEEYKGHSFAEVLSNAIRYYTSKCGA